MLSSSFLGTVNILEAECAKSILTYTIVTKITNSKNKNYEAARGNELKLKKRSFDTNRYIKRVTNQKLRA